MKLILKKIKVLSLEEKILNGGYILSIIGFFMPWISGTSLTNEEFAFNGFSYYVSFMGFTAAILLLFCVSITLVPLLYNQKLILQKE